MIDLQQKFLFLRRADLEFFLRLQNRIPLIPSSELESKDDGDVSIMEFGLLEQKMLKISGATETSSYPLLETDAVVMVAVVATE